MEGKEACVGESGDRVEKVRTCRLVFARLCGQVDEAPRVRLQNRGCWSFNERPPGSFGWRRVDGAAGRSTKTLTLVWRVEGVVVDVGRWTRTLALVCRVEGVWKG